MKQSSANYQVGEIDGYSIFAFQMTSIPASNHAIVRLRLYISTFNLRSTTEAVATS